MNTKLRIVLTSERADLNYSGGNIHTEDDGNGWTDVYIDVEDDPEEEIIVASVRTSQISHMEFSK